VGEDFDTIEELRARAHQVRQALQRNLACRPARLSYPAQVRADNAGLIRMQWPI